MRVIEYLIFYSIYFSVQYPIIESTIIVDITPAINHKKSLGINKVIKYQSSLSFN